MKLHLIRLVFFTALAFIGMNIYPYVIQLITEYPVLQEIGIATAVAVVIVFGYAYVEKTGEEDGSNIRKDSD